MSEYTLSLDHTKYPLTVVDGNQLTLSLNGATGPAGINGVAGPNQVTTSTLTSLTGYIYGNGTTVGGATTASSSAQANTLVLRSANGAAQFSGITGENAVEATATGTGKAIYGVAVDGIGVNGQSTSLRGVSGSSVTGVGTYGASNSGVGGILSSISGTGAEINSDSGTYTSVFQNTSVTTLAIERLLGVLRWIQGASAGRLTPSTLTGVRTWTLPNKSGTVAMTTDITPSSEEAVPYTLARRDLNGTLKGTDVWCVGPDVETSGNLLLFDPANSGYTAIGSYNNITEFYPTGIGYGAVRLSPSSNTGNATLAFQNSADENYTFPFDGGTLLANTGNLVGLTNLSTARSSLGLGTDASPTFRGLTLNNDTLLTVSTPNTITQTWNASGTAFTAVKVNATQGVNGSSASSLLLDMQLDSVSKFNVKKDGAITAVGNALFKNAVNSSTAFQIQKADGTEIIRVDTSNGSSYFGGGVLAVSQASGVSSWYVNGQIGWSSSNAGINDLTLTRKDPASLRLGAADTTGTTAPVAQTLGVQSWASSTTFNQTGAAFTIAGSQGTGTGAGGSINFQTATPSGTASGTQNPLTTKLTILGSGNVGIGTTTPAQKLSVVGDINATGNLTLGTALTIANGGTGATSASVARSNLEIGTGLENPFVDETTGARTLGLTDAGKYIRCTSASAITITIPTNAVTAFPINSVIYIRRAGAGVITLSITGVTVNDNTSTAVPTGGVFALKKIATDTWDFI